MPNTLNIFRLIGTFEVEVDLGGELEQIRLELFRGGPAARSYRMRSWRMTFVQSVIAFDDQSEEADVSEWQTIEDFSELFEPTDLEFEADTPEAAEQQALDLLQLRVTEASFPKAPTAN